MDTSTTSIRSRNHLEYIFQQICQGKPSLYFWQPTVNILFQVKSVKIDRYYDKQ